MSSYPTFKNSFNLGTPTPLVFPIGKRARVEHGHFWKQDGPDGLDLGRGFFWSAWFAPLTTGQPGYLISDSYSGAHALLWGLDGANTITGNVWNGVGSQSFNGTYKIRPGEWVHVALSWDGKVITTWINGIAELSTPFAGPRKTIPTGAGHALMYVGGSDHMNLAMKLAYIEGYETSLPYIPTWIAEGRQAFCPARFPYLYDRTYRGVDFACNYTDITSGPLIDLSEGYAPPNGGPKVRHHGLRDHGESADFVNLGASAGPTTNPTRGTRPHWEYDPTCPYGQEIAIGDDYLGETVPVLKTPPAGAKIFDGFSRRNQTWASHVNPTLGRTEVGDKVWKVKNTWGILDGKAVPLGGGDRPLPSAIVMSDSPDMEVSVSCDIRTGSDNAANKIRAYGQDKAFIILRATDNDNYYLVGYTWYSNSLIISKMVNGNASRIHVASNHVLGRTLSASFVGTTLKVYFDDRQVGQLEDLTDFRDAIGAGIAAGEAIFEADSTYRYTDFAVF